MHFLQCIYTKKYDNINTESLKKKVYWHTWQHHVVSNSFNCSSVMESWQHATWNHLKQLLHSIIETSLSSGILQ